jgi:hypothetical protein
MEKIDEEQKAEWIQQIEQKLKELGGDKAPPHGR